MTENEHLLTCLNEECLEVAKDADKALRFGLDDWPPDDPLCVTNRERIVNELNDILGVARLLVSRGILPADWQSENKQWAKGDRVLINMSRAKELGTVQ